MALMGGGLPPDGMGPDAALDEMLNGPLSAMAGPLGEAVGP
jgi:hypothetical protein